MLDYDRRLVVQETGWWCGPAAVQTVLQAKGIKLAESSIAAAIEQIENPGRGDDRDGTDYIGLIETYLDRQVPDARYTSVYMPNDPPTSNQREKLWRDLTKSINAGYGVVANIVSPPNNKPAATKGSVPPPYPRGIYTFHYVAIMGYDSTSRAVWIADSAAFGGITGWWCPFEGPGSITSLIPPKGYCFADVQDVVAVSPDLPSRLWVEWSAFLGERESLTAIIRAAQSDLRAQQVLALTERLNPDALKQFIAKG
jgi:hypothetical protein